MNAGSTTGTEPSSSDAEAWDRAYRRTVAFLRAYQFHNALYRNQRAQEIVALAKARIQPGETPEVHAIRLVRERIATWEQAVCNELKLEGHNLGELELRTILEVARIPSRWPMCFLQNPPYPEALLDTLHEAKTVKIPAFQTQQFGQPQLSFPLTSSFLEATGGWLRKWPIVRIFLGWLIAGCILGAIVLFVR